MITAHTSVVGVIGDPVGHSLSPAIHNAAFGALGLDWVYVAFPVPAGSGAAAVAAVRTLGLAGLNVTMPHKADAAAAVSRLSPTAEVLASVNTVYRRGDQVWGDSTDGEGFLDALRKDEGFDPAGRRVAIAGAGGAARAVILALAAAGASDIAVLNRTRSRAEAAATLAGLRGRVGSDDDVDQADLVVNATPMGMGGELAGAIPIDPLRLHPGQVVADLVYWPARTPLLAAAKERGCVAVSGLGMLIHQAAHSFRLWTSEDPPLEVMSAAALGALLGE